jgi:hypothetical protein
VPLGGVFFCCFRSISEATAPVLPIILEDKTKPNKPVEEPVKKVQKTSEAKPEGTTPNPMAYILPNEMDHEIRACLEKLVKVSSHLVKLLNRSFPFSAKLILADQNADTTQKKIERLFNSTICRELLE